MKTLNLFMKLVLWIQLLILAWTFSAPQIQDVFVYQQTGHDTPTCGLVPSSPCKTISMGVWRTAQHARVYIDGTGSETTPYTCKSPSLPFPGIYSNKSVVFIGVNSIVYVKCQEGSGVRFENAHKVDTRVSLTNIKFMNTSVEAHDISLDIDRCVFTDARQAINIQSASNFTISFSNSICENSSSCMAVLITQSLLPISVSIVIKNSSIVQSWCDEHYSLSDKASGIYVTSKGEYEPGDIACDVVLENVSFKHNNIGLHGLIYMNLKNAFTSITLDKVFFLETKNSVTYVFSLISIYGSYNHHFTINNTEFQQNYKGIYSAITLNIENTSSLSIMNSTFTSFDLGNYLGVVQLESSKVCTVSIVQTIFSGTNGSVNGAGSCLSINSQTATVDIQNSLFKDNKGKCAGVLWLNTNEHAMLAIHGSHFESNTAQGPGGLGVIQSKEAVIEMTNCVVDRSIPGGVFDIGFNGCFEQKEVYNASLRLQRVTVSNTGSVAGIGAHSVTVEIMDSTVYDISSVFGVLNVAFSKNGQFITVVNTTFTNIHGSIDQTGVAITAQSITSLTVESVMVENVQSPQGSAFFLVPIEEGLIKINNTKLKHFNGFYPAFVIFTIKKFKISVIITNSVFESSQSLGKIGGCLAIATGFANATLHNVTFKNCISGQNGAVYLVVTGGNISINSCQFFDNRSLKTKGGAISVELGKDTVIDPECSWLGKHSLKNNSIKTSNSHRTWQYNGTITIQDSIFINNTAVNGGALSLSRGNHIIKSCTFTDNFAEYQGGHIFITSDSTSLKLIDSNFTQKHSKLTVSDHEDLENVTKYGLGYGMFISSQSYGPLLIFNSTLESNTSKNSESQTLLSIASSNHIIFNSETKIKCPRGSELNGLNIPYEIDTQYKSLECYIALAIVRFTCKPCSIDYYSLQRGHSLGMNVVSGFQCLTCPFGAECNSNISAKTNFWGYAVKENPTELNFTLCPLGYCKQPDKQDFLDYNSCQGNRTGTLCGHCKENYTETILSTDCRHDNECNDSWMLGVVVAMVMLMALYLIYKPHLLHMLSRKILWFRSKSIGNADKPSQLDQGKSDGVKSGGGYLKIVFYFYQIANLLLVSTSYTTTVEKYMVQPVIGIFNFQYRISSNGFLCPFPGLNAVSKQFLFTTQVFGVLLMITVTYYCHCLLCKCKSKPPPSKGPYLAASVETLLLGYMAFATTSLRLLNCKLIGDQMHFFISGDVVCYQWWQYLLMGFVGVVIFPFIVTLALGSHWLYNDTVSVKEFLLGCVLPLPYIAFKLIIYLCGVCKPNNKQQVDQRPQIYHTINQSQSKPQNEIQQETSQTPETVQQDQVPVCHGPQRDTQSPLQQDSLNTGENQAHKESENKSSQGARRPLQRNQRRGPATEPSDWKICVTKVLYGPFRGSSMYWESILISRRLLIILIHVFVHNPSLKGLLLVLVCVIILYHHSITRPFTANAANNIETMSLLILVIIATINFFKASFISIGQEPKGPLKSLVISLDTVQIVLLMVLPVICALAVVFVIVSQIVRVKFQVCGYFRCKLSGDYHVIDGDVNQSLVQPCESNDNDINT